MRNKCLEFSSYRRGKDESVSTLINLSDHTFVLPLDRQAQGLELEMQLANLEANPVEIPDPMPATFSSVTPAQRSPSSAAWLHNTKETEHTTTTTSKPILAGTALPSRGQANPSRKAPSLLPGHGMKIQDNRIANVGSDVLDPMVAALVQGFPEIAALTPQLPSRAKGFPKAPLVEVGGSHKVNVGGDDKERAKLNMKTHKLSNSHVSIGLLFEIIMYCGYVVKGFWHWIICWSLAAIDKNRKEGSVSSNLRAEGMVSKEKFT